MPLLLETIWVMITVRAFNVLLCLFWNHEKFILLPCQVDMQSFPFPVNYNCTNISKRSAFFQRFRFYQHILPSGATMFPSQK
jgi:hypothetical protein